MKFAELNVGDWFKVADENSEVIWIKTGETRSRPINYYGDDAIDLADGHASTTDFEVVFCPRYIWADETCAGEWKFGAYPNHLELVKSFDAIPIGAVYKGRGEVYYRKFSETKSFIIWTHNPETIGRIFAYKPNQAGTYFICHFFNFSFPEMT